MTTSSKRRNFKRFKEPKAKVAKSAGNAAFVVQMHAARSLHYDLRLEVGGVMKSWAVPICTWNKKLKRISRDMFKAYFC